MLKKALAIAAILFGAGNIAACETMEKNESNEEKWDDVGDEIEEGVEEIGDAMKSDEKDFGDEVEEAGDQVGEELDDFDDDDKPND